ncbi:MAG: acylphosphatase [Lachnospiraceae bacterium]|nr:acylphosphatase [Lachnospiraceae bacterium]
MSIKRKRIIFSGRVQGVGFRYRAAYAAESLGLTGWVKNEWDETVSMEVQGEEELIDKLVDRMYKERYIRIEGISVMNMSLVEGEKRFSIQY